jgi:membrane protease YdiL (CAAX protease family)
MSGTGSTTVSPAVSRLSAFIEVAALALVLLSYIWLWNGAFPGHSVVLLALYFGIGIETHWRRGERPREIGLRLDNLGRALRLVTLWIAPIAVFAMAAGFVLHGWRFPNPEGVIGSVAFGVAYGTAQQYGLVCVFYRRLREVFRGDRLPIVAAGLLFGLFHLPNPFLTAVTVTLGMLACWLYRREPNLLALGIWHGLMSFVLFYSLPVWLTIELRVGPQILSYLAWPF